MTTKCGFQPGGTFFFTVITAERRPLFSDDAARAYLRTAIHTVQAKLPFDIVAIVPDFGKIIITGE